MNNKTFAILGIVLSSLIIPTVNAKSFSDLNSTHKNYSAIQSLAEKGIVEGYDDGKFKPEQKINRAEFLKIVIESAFAEDQIANCIEYNTLPNWTYAFFPDVKLYTWYSNYICTAKMQGFIKGYPDGQFKPSNEINYVEALKIIFATNHDSGVINTKGEEWYSPYTEAVQSDGTDIEVALDHKLTRGEMAQLIHNYMNKRKIGKYADQTELDLEPISELDMFSYENEEAGFGVMLPNAWKDYELKKYEMVDDMCNNAIANVYYFVPKDMPNFEIDMQKNELPLMIMRYNAGEYCTASYQWQQDAIALYKKNDPTADPSTVYLGSVYSRMKTIQNEKYLYQVYPFQNDDDESNDSFIYDANMDQINFAVMTFDSLEE